MFTFDRADAQRIAVSALGAIALSATCVFGAVGPARSAAPQTAPAWIAADGAVTGAGLARSSGNAFIDSKAVNVADRLAHPPLPASLHGTPQSVAMPVAAR